MHVQNNHTPKVHQPQLASEVLSVLFLCQQTAVGISSTLQHRSVFYSPGVANPSLLIRLKANVSKHEVNPNQINFWHQIIRHKSVLYLQSWFPLIFCHPGARASLYTSYCMSTHWITSRAHYIIKYLYNKTGEKCKQIQKIHPCNILLSLKGTYYAFQ